MKQDNKLKEKTQLLITIIIGRPITRRKFFCGVEGRR
jgi:hypothetical protein